MAKKIKESKHNALGTDPLSEHMYGEGAVRLGECRVILNGGRTVQIGEHTINKIGIYGAVLTDKDITNSDGQFQMWECDIIVIPRKKYRKGYIGHRADQALADDFANPDNWEEQIFDIKDSNENTNNTGGK